MIRHRYLGGCGPATTVDVTLVLRFDPADVPEGVDIDAWAANLVTTGLRESDFVEPVSLDAHPDDLTSVA